MKKKYLFIVLFILLFLTACSEGTNNPNNNGTNQPDVPDTPDIPDKPEEDKIIDIVVEDIVACIDNFDISIYTFTVKYSYEEVVKNLSLSLLSQSDQEKLLEVGEHQVTLVYNNFSKVINIILEEFKAIEFTAHPSSITSYLNEFDYEDIQLEVKYNDGTDETFALSKDFLSSKDIVSLGKPGTYDIVIEYEDLTTTIHFELLPNETKIEDLKQDVIIYCITKKVEDKYISTFYALGNKEFSGMQFKVNKTSNVQDDIFEAKNDNISYINTEEGYVIMFVNPENINGLVELFSISYISKNQYRNFTLDYEYDTKVIYIIDKVTKTIEDYLFTFTR